MHVLWTSYCAVTDMLVVGGLCGETWVVAIEKQAIKIVSIINRYLVMSRGNIACVELLHLQFTQLSVVEYQPT